jgi:hypothetical protein
MHWESKGHFPQLRNNLQGFENINWGGGGTGRSDQLSAVSNQQKKHHWSLFML